MGVDFRDGIIPSQPETLRGAGLQIATLHTVALTGHSLAEAGAGRLFELLAIHAR